MNVEYFIIQQAKKLLGGKPDQRCQRRGIDTAATPDYSTLKIRDGFVPWVQSYSCSCGHFAALLSALMAGLNALLAWRWLVDTDRKWTRGFIGHNLAKQQTDLQVRSVTASTEGRREPPTSELPLT